MCKIDFKRCMHHVKSILRLAHIVYIQFYMIHKPCEIEYDILAINFCVYIRFNMTTISRIFEYLGKIKNTDIRS